VAHWLSVVFFVVGLGPVLILFFWDGYLSLQMFNHLKRGSPAPWGRKLAFQTDPLDYDVTGQIYRLKSIWLEIALLGWGIGLPLLAVLVVAITL